MCPPGRIKLFLGPNNRESRRKVGLFATGLVACASLVAVARPAAAWDDEECADWYEEKGEIHEDCQWWTPPTTVPETTTTTVPETTTTTVEVTPLPEQVEAVVVTAPAAQPVVVDRLPYTG